MKKKGTDQSVPHLTVNMYLLSTAANRTYILFTRGLSAQEWDISRQGKEMQVPTLESPALPILIPLFKIEPIAEPFLESSINQKRLFKSN